MKLHTMKSAQGSRKKRTRKGIGDSSAGRGEKGYSKREGNAQKLGFEGGQTPLYRRIPKQGFTNFTKQEYDVLNLVDIETFNLAEISPEILLKAKLYKPRNKRLKILGNSITKPITIKAHAFSKSAEAAITKAGGKVEIIK